MNIYDILICVCVFLFILGILISVSFFMKSDDQDSFVNCFGLSVFLFFFSYLFSYLFLDLKYHLKELQEEKNINNYVFENISKHDLFLANTIKENTSVCINKNILKFITNSNSQKLINVIEAKNSKKKITENNYAEIYQPCLTEYLNKSSSEQDYNIKLEILKKSNLIK